MNGFIHKLVTGVPHLIHFQTQVSTLERSCALMDKTMDLLCLESWKGWDFSCLSSCVYSVEADELKGFKATFRAVFRAHLTTETTGLQLNIENCDSLERCEKLLL